MNGNELSNQDKENGLPSHGKTKPIPPAKPKPKPAGKRLQIQATGVSSNSSPIRLPPSKFKTTLNGVSDDNDIDDQEQDPGDITLDPDSLSQFAKIDLDAVKRYEMLDSTAQRQKAYLGYGKGLQNRRLPSHISSKVGDDYYQKRKSYDPKILLDSKPVETGTRARSGTELTNTVPEYQADKENMSMEDKQKELMNRIGVPPQGAALAGLASIFKKGSSTKKLQRSASGTPRDRQAPPEVKVKPTKKLSDTSSPNLSRVKNDPSGSPSIRSSFKNKLFKKKKGKLSRGSSTDDMRGSTDDLWSETSSLSSISRISIREEDAFEGNFPHKDFTSPKHVEGTPPMTSPSRDGRVMHDEDSPPNKPPTVTSTPLPKEENNSILTSPSRDKDRSDSIFKDMSGLFGDKDNLFDSAELSNLLAKTKSEFGDNKESTPQDEGKAPSPEKPSAAVKPKPKISITSEETKVPSKPMRKNRSRVLDTSIYDKAAEKAIKSVNERKLEREKEKELERKKEEEKKKPKIALFEDLDDDDDLFGGKGKKTEEKTDKKSANINDLFDEQTTPVSPVHKEKKEIEKKSTTTPNERPKISGNKTNEEITVSQKLANEEKKQKVEEKAVKVNKPDEQVKPDEPAKPDDLPKPKHDEQVKPDDDKLTNPKPDEPSKSSKEAKEVKSKIKTSLFDDLEDEDKNDETTKSLFGDEKENFMGKISGSAKTTTSTSKPVAKKADVVESKKPEVKVIKPVITPRKPSITSPTHKELSPPPTKTKPPVISVKPKRATKGVEEENMEKDKKTEEPVKKEDKKQEEPVKKEEGNAVEEKKSGKHEEKTILTVDIISNENDKDGKNKDEKLKDEGETISEKKEDVKKEVEKEKSSKEPVGNEKDNKTTTEEKKDDSKAFPEWKKKLEEKRLQREKEDRDMALKLEERKKKREENKLSTQDRGKSPSAVSPKPTKKPMLPKEKPKPTPITSGGTTVTLSSKSTAPEKDKSPGTPDSPLKTPPLTKESSPSKDPSLPKWKQDLLAKKKQTEGTTTQPGSPRKSTVSVTVEKKGDNLPAWKKELLAKKKAVGGEGTSSGSKSTGSPKTVRSSAKDQPVPEFMKEFKNKRKT